MTSADFIKCFLPLLQQGHCPHTIGRKYDLYGPLCFEYTNHTQSNHPSVNALHVAVQCNHHSVIQWLLSTERFDVNATTGFHGDTALHLAACSKTTSVDTVKLLVEHGADINLCSAHTGQSALLLSLQRRRFDIAQYLISKGCDVNIGLRDGITPIFYAVKCKRTDWVKALVDAGADQTRHGDVHGSLIGLAIRDDDLDTALALLDGDDAEVNSLVDVRHFNIKILSLSLAIYRCMYRAEFGENVTRFTRSLL